MALDLDHPPAVLRRHPAPSVPPEADVSALGAAVRLGHEQVSLHQEPEADYLAIVAIHSSVLGPAVGGTRLFAYPSLDDALLDALRLSRGMTYKNAAAGLPFGGAKAVILGDSRRPDRERVFRAHGRTVERFGGRFITAEDVGTSDRDVATIGRETRHVRGFGDLGPPSPWTARGVFRAIQAAARERWGARRGGRRARGDLRRARRHLRAVRPGRGPRRPDNPQAQGRDRRRRGEQPAARRPPRPSARRARHPLRSRLHRQRRRRPQLHRRSPRLAAHPRRRAHRRHLRHDAGGLRARPPRAGAAVRGRRPAGGEPPGGGPPPGAAGPGARMRRLRAAGGARDRCRRRGSDQGQVAKAPVSWIGLNCTP